MSDGLGKKFEQKFKEDFLKLPGSTIDRLYDVTIGYKNIKQVSDYIGYCFPNIFYLELKSHKGASLPLCNITQYDSLLSKRGIPGVRAGVVLWLYDKDKVLYIPIDTVEKIKNSGKKSVGLIDLSSNPMYNIIEIPSIKKRIFMDSDYSVLKNLEEGM